MTEKMKRPQIILTRTENMSKRNQIAFDILKSWERNRLTAIADMLELLFTDEELSDPDECMLRLSAMMVQRKRGGKLISVQAPAPVPATLPINKEAKAEPELVQDVPAPADEPEDVPYDFNDLAKDFNG